MASSTLLRRISRKSVVGSSKWISEKVSSKYPNLMSGCGAGISTMSVSSGDPSVLGPSSLPSRISPWLMLPPAFEGGDMVYKFYGLAENKVQSFNKRGSGTGGGGEEEIELPDDDAKFVGSSHGWLALFNQRNNDLFLSNPLSRRHIKLPPIHTLPDPEINLRNGHGSVSKVIISCSPDEDDCRAMMTFGPGDRLAFCVPRRSTEWTPIGDLFLKDEDCYVREARVYEDFVYCSTQKLFTCVTQYDMEDWDLRDPESPRINWMEEQKLEFECENSSCFSEDDEEVLGLCREIQYLVFAEESNELFLVMRAIMPRTGPDGSYVKNGGDDRYPYKTKNFEVYKVDREGGKLRFMEEGSLDGLAIFIGINHSFAMSAAEFPELNPNSIYFTDAKELTPPDSLTKIYGGHDIGIFNYQNKTFSSCYYPCDVQSIQRIVPPPMWFTPSPH